MPCGHLEAEHREAGRRPADPRSGCAQIPHRPPCSHNAPNQGRFHYRKHRMDLNPSGQNAQRAFWGRAPRSGAQAGGSAKRMRANPSSPTMNVQRPCSGAFFVTRNTAFHFGIKRPSGRFFHMRGKHPPATDHGRGKRPFSCTERAGRSRHGRGSQGPRAASPHVYDTSKNHLTRRFSRLNCYAKPMTWK